jgi:hypothetical protein
VCVCVCVCVWSCKRPTPANMYFKQRLTRLSARRASGQRRKAATLLVSSFRHDIIAHSRSVTHSASLTRARTHIQASRAYACAHKCHAGDHIALPPLSLALSCALSLARARTHTHSLPLSLAPPPLLRWFGRGRRHSHQDSRRRLQRPQDS